MDKIAVFLNDAGHAEPMLRPLLQGSAPAHWVLIACPPTLTRHVGRWVTTAAKQQWRERWAEELFAKVGPMFRAAPGARLEKLVARRPLIDMAKRLDERLGGVKVFDARRPRLARPNDPLQPGQPSREISRWTYPVAISTGLSAMLALAD